MHMVQTIAYLLALEEHGLEKVHERVGREPSGRNLNDLILDHRNLPYNPLVNSGALLCTALIRPALALADVCAPSVIG
jgi:glutaminase